MPRPPDFCPHIDSLSTRVFSGLATKAARMRADGKTVHMLSVGDTYEEPPVEARVDQLSTGDLEGIHQYSSPVGIPELLEAVGDKTAALGRRVSPERLQIVAGATSGLSVIARALLDVGDEVLLPSPFWPLIRGIIAKTGATAVQIPLFHDLASLDVRATLEAAITERTVALYVNAPHNPTGAVLSKELADAFVDVARRHDLWLICDEAYQDIYFDEEGEGASTSSTASGRLWTRDDVQDRYVACHTLSKSYGMAGARIGYAHGSESVAQAIRATQAFDTYCAAKPMQLAGARALRHGDAYLARRRPLFAAAATRAAETFGVPVPAGGTFLFFDAHPYLRDEEADALPFLDRCLDAGVLLTPGHSCGEAFGRWVRLCFTAVGPSELDDALERLKSVLES